MLDLSQVKVAFFDLDGVLSVPRYIDKNGATNCGMIDNDWFNTCQEREDVYKDCIAPFQVINLLSELKKDGVKLFVLTHETNSGAYFNKVNFILDKYSEFFSSYKDVLFVSKPMDKIKLMKSLANINNYNYSECLLVEDMFDTCLQANNEGFQVMHISELLVRECD